MGKRKIDDKDKLRDEWPRIRAVTVKGDRYYSCDGRPEFKRKAFPTLAAAREQAETWCNARTRYGRAGRFISERDASRVAQAFDLLKPHGADILDAARHFARHLEAEKTRAASKPTADALQEWVASYDGKDRDPGTKVELRSKARIFGQAFGHLKLGDVSADKLRTWIDGYEAEPGKPAAPQTRANLKTKLSQFLRFAKLKKWIEENVLEGIKGERPPRAPVAIFDVKQVLRIIAAADRSASREIVLPYAVLCIFAGLRPNSEAEQIRWQDINFDSGDLHVRAGTSKTREERFCPMEANLIAWLETCPIRPPGPIIGLTPSRFRRAWELVKREAGFKVGAAPENGWPGTAQEWPPDAMRHTFASNWLATHKSRAELAERMGNSEGTIKSHYRRAIRPDDAREFWSIMPVANKAAKIIRMEGAA